jgi:hypothetical protein
VIVGSSNVTLPVSGLQFSDAFRNNNGVLEKAAGAGAGRHHRRGAGVGDPLVWRDGVNTTLSTPPNMKFWQATKISNGHVVGYGVTTGDQNLSGGPGPSVNSAGRVIARLDVANGGNDQTDTGFGVWDQGKFVSQFGDAKLDLPVVVGDDGSVCGYSGSGDQIRPFSWRCS